MTLKPDHIEQYDLLFDTMGMRIGVVDWVNASPGCTSVSITFMGQNFSETIDHYTLINQYRLIRMEKFEQ